MDFTLTLNQIWKTNYDDNKSLYGYLLVLGTLIFGILTEILIIYSFIALNITITLIC